MKKSRSFSPNRLSLDFRRAGEDLPDEWYEEKFIILFTDIYDLVQSVFCPDDNAQAPRVSPWLREYSNEFVNYVKLVAHPDPRAGKWERLLRDKLERASLLTAIIFKVLDTKVLSHLLFGASEEQEELLCSSDAAFIDVEGFERTRLRAHINRVSHKGEAPPLFWDEVDELCTQTVALLEPAYDYAAEFRGYRPISKSKLHQFLHDVIAYAGWINVHIRMASAIVSCDWVHPGEPFSMGQVNLWQEAYIASKEAAQQHQQRLLRRRPDSQEMKSMARVKISVTPKIVRHKAVSESIGTPGMTTYELLAPHIVYYKGLELDSDEKRAFVSLPEYIQRLREQLCAPRGASFAIMLVVLLYLWVSMTATGYRAWQGAWSLVNPPEPKPEPSKSWWNVGSWF
ncbi:hypothetical protein ACHAPT_000445 [Fusarium lateritium]